MTVRDPVLLPVAIASLRPTQITVGQREVDIKRKAWRARSKKADERFLGRHMLPAVLGPGQRHYIVDHHHLALALWREGVEDVLVNTLSDLSGLEPPAFWLIMDARGWAHPYDAKGELRPYKDIPRSLKKLRDDPFRSLAGELRRRGGFAKETVPFAEFQWADLLRRHFKRAQVESDFDSTLKKALALARSPAAAYLPGWCGPAPED